MSLKFSRAWLQVGMVAAAFAVGALALPASALPPIVRPHEDEVIYQIMPIAWRDSNLDVTGSVQTRFGDFGGLASVESASVPSLSSLRS